MTNISANNGRMTPLGYQNSTHTVGNNWAAFATQNAMMVGWSANLGNTWSAALATLNNWFTAQYSVIGTAYFGISTSIAVGATPGNVDPGIAIIGTGSSQAIDGSVATGNPVVLQPIYTSPEPGTMALTGLGGLCLLALRRKK